MFNANTEMTLRQIGLFLANLAEKSEDVYWLSSPDFKSITYISPAYEKVWGRSRDELYADPAIWINFMHPEDVKNYHPIIAMAERVSQLGTEARYDESYRIVRPDGEVRWIIDRGFPIYTPQGECCGVMGVAMDVTKDKLAAEQLRIAYELAERANQAKSEFIANVSHDIRTPFAGISEMAKYLAKREVDPKKKEELGYIIESSQRLLNFLNEVIDFAKLDSGTRPITLDEFDMKELIEDVVGIMLAQSKQKGIDLRLEYPDDLPVVLVSDRLRIHRILLNLVSNAMKFTEQGYVEIRLEIAKREAEQIILDLIVEDTGIGIPHDKLNDIFEHFTRLSPSYSGTYNGTGLGLPIAKKFAEEIGGNMRVESEMGKGTRFIFTLPLKLPRNAKHIFAEALQSLDVAEEILEKNVPRILLVEDDKLIQIVTRNIVTDLGYEIDIAHCAKEAKTYLKNKTYDIILMDLGLPDQDGISLAEDIKKNLPVTAPIIAVTAHLSEKNEEKCHAAGMKEIVHKPLTAEKFQMLMTSLERDAAKAKSVVGL